MARQFNVNAARSTFELPPLTRLKDDTYEWYVRSNEMATITISESIKQEIAERVVEQAHPGYSTEYMGEWYVVDGARLTHKQRNAPWAPWADDAKVISVDDLVWYFGGAAEENADFTDYESDEEGREIAIEFALCYVPDSYNTVDYEAIFG